MTEYEQVLDFLERVKSSSSTHSREAIAATYDYIYGELIDTYYALSTSSRESQDVYANKAFNAAELNKARNFTHTWGAAFIDALRHKLAPSQVQKEDELSDKEASLQSQLDHPLTDGGSVRKPEIEKTLEHVRADQNELVSSLRQTDPVYAEIRYPTSHSISDLPLRPGELLIEFKMFDPALFVWEVEGTSSGSKIIAFYKVERSRKWFQDRITEIRAVMNRGTPEAFDPKISEELFQAIFPLRQAQILEEAKAIIFVPDDLLFSIPFELLSPNATRNDYTLIGKPTSYFASAAAFRLDRSIGHVQRTWGVSMLGVADPVTSKDDPRFGISSLATWLHPAGEAPTVKDQSSIQQEDRTRDATLSTRGFYFDRLPETSSEVESIAALFERKNMTAVIRVGMDATKAELLRTDLGQYRFLHFATHGFLPVEPGALEPALILSYDGTSENNMMLTSSEVLSLNLHTDMVVLSACNTGSGVIHRAEGVASLGTAFLAAGSSSVAVSLWKVSDKSTSLFMQDFYLHLLTGMPKNEALATARTDLAAKGYRNPFFWAPFVLSGE